MRILFLLVCISILSCHDKPVEKERTYEEQLEFDKKVERKIAETMQRADTVGRTVALSNKYLQVVKYKIYEKEYFGKGISITIKNTSGYDIDGVKLKVSTSNNFGESRGSFNAVSQDLLKVNKTVTLRWDLPDDQATKAEVFPVSIHFKDGNHWQLYR